MSNKYWTNEYLTINQYKRPVAHFHLETLAMEDKVFTGEVKIYFDRDKAFYAIYDILMRTNHIHFRYEREDSRYREIDISCPVILSCEKDTEVLQELPRQYLQYIRFTFRVYKDDVLISSTPINGDDILD